MKSEETCFADRMGAFLREELDPALERQVESHLEDCEHCRKALEQSAATVDWWSETTQLLRDWETTAEQEETPAFDLRFLHPTDDPRMLGRLGQHEICGVIGSGGMGIVFKAFDASLNRYVAIKVLAPNLASSGAARKRFIREARAAAAVVQDNVIAIHGVETTGAIPYLIMPYIKGESLQRRIDRDGPLETESVLRIGMQIARGLAAAHEQGLIHRDVKPANVLLPTSIERVVLTDFGLARAVDDATLTHSGVIAGTPQYMSPEQAKGDPIDPRSDLFSLGSVLYAMAAGRPPFRAETAYGIIRRIVDTEPKSLTQINPQIPAWLVRLVDWLHQKSPDDRPENAAVVAEMMEKCLGELQSGGDAIPRPLLRPSTPTPRAPTNPFWKPLTVIGIMVFLLIVGGLLGQAFVEYRSRVTKRSTVESPSKTKASMNSDSTQTSDSSGAAVSGEQVERIEAAFESDDKILRSIESDIDQWLSDSENLSSE